MKGTCTALFPLVAIASLASATLYTDANQLPYSVYDYVVVGGMYLDPTRSWFQAYVVYMTAGTAGNVIAARLSENALSSVLVIEAGISCVCSNRMYAPIPIQFSCSDAGLLGVQVPFLAPTNVPFSPVTWNYTTVPQAELDQRIVTYARGRVLGGSSSISMRCLSVLCWLFLIL